jgi:hypothetical protein
MNRLSALVLTICLLGVSSTLATEVGTHVGGPYESVGSIEGNATLESQPASYTVLALPVNYKSDPASQDIIRGFNGSNADLVSLRNSTKFVCYVADDPDFKHRWAAVMPQVVQGQVGVVVEDAGKVVYCNYGMNSKQMSKELRSSKYVSRNCPSCRPHPKPQPEVKPEPVTPITPIQPTIAPTVTPAPESSANVPQAIAIVTLCCAALGVVIFRMRM